MQNIKIYIPECKRAGNNINVYYHMSKMKYHLFHFWCSSKEDEPFIR